MVPGRTLGRFLDAVEPDLEALVEIIADTETTFRVGESQLTLRQFDPDTWPQFSDAGVTVGSLDQDDADRIRSVLLAASADPDRGALVGVHLASGFATATDNHRLARVELSTELPPVLVPASFLQYTLRSAEPLQVRMSANQIRLVDATGWWATQLLLHPFPNVEPVLNRPVSAEIAFDTATLRRALDHLAVLDRVHVVQLFRPPDRLATLSASDEALGRIDEHLAVEGTWSGTACSAPATSAMPVARAHDVASACLQFTGDTKHVLLLGDAIRQAIGTQRWMNCRRALLHR